MKKKPSGFVATCLCGVIVGAMDLDRTDRKEAGRLLGKWLEDGCTIHPQFGAWSVHVEACKCNQPVPHAETAEAGEVPNA